MDKHFFNKLGRVKRKSAFKQQKKKKKKKKKNA